MQLKILYVEDDEKSVEQLMDELEIGNKDLPEWSKVELLPIVHPSDLPIALANYPDVVLADIFFYPKGTSPPAQQKPHLDQIIKEVREWDKKSPHGFPTPIIAYTGRGEVALKECLKQREALYDIWSKAPIGPEYVVWRFQRLSSELQRHRPDATVQRLLAGMSKDYCPSWHQHMLRMIKSYGEGQTEYEQLIKCRDPLQSILNIVDAKHAVSFMTLWDVLVESEPLLRALEPKLRGFARHSINVFWIGYWIINHPLLRDEIINLWKKMVSNRSDVQELKAVDPNEGFNIVWLYASLFHDAGKFHEYGKAITEVSAKFYDEFNSLNMGKPSWNSGKGAELPKSLDQLLYSISTQRNDPMTNALKAYIKRSSQNEKPDHGAIAAAYLMNIGGGSGPCDLFSQYIFEAAKAILMHSCLPGVFDELPKDKRDNCHSIQWQRDPLASLLLFCDQIQTWDRHDPTKEIKDYPDRAELSYLTAELDKESKKLIITGCIDYIVPSRVDMYPELREDIATLLNKVILEKPKTTLLHVIEEDHWPFSVHLDCALSGDKLSIDMDFE